MDELNLVLAARLLLREVKSDTVYRIVTPDGAGHYTALCDINATNSWPIIESTERIRERLSQNEPDETRLVLELDDPWSTLTRPARPNYDQAKLEATWALIEPLVTGQNAFRVMLKARRNKILNGYAQEKNTSRQRLSRLLKMFWKRGLVIEALWDDMDNCGGKGKPKNYKKAMPGKRNRHGLPGVPLSETVRKLLNIAVDYYLAAPEERTMQGALDRLAVHFGNVREISDSNGVTVTVGISLADQPTIDQLRYQIKQRRYVDIQKSKFGEREFELAKRHFTGRADQHVTGPGDQFVLDATIADVYLVSQFDRTLIVGRPTVYLVVDVFSRLIVGMYVGFEPPSWTAAMIALVNVVTPKVAWCAQYDQVITEEQWPSHHLPSSLLGDKAEMMKLESGNLIVKSLRVDIDNPRAWRPDLKALVETRFDMIKAKFSAFTPGLVKADFGERGKHDYRLDAALDINDFTRVMIWAVLQYNAAPIVSYPTAPEMIAEGRAPTPLNLWKFGVASRSGTLRFATIDEVRLNVLPRLSGSVTHRGIEFFGVFYECPTAIHEDWFSKARESRWSVTIAYDPRDAGIVWLCHVGKFEMCTRRMTNPLDMKIQNITLAERNQQKLLNEKNIINEENEHLRLRVRANEAMDAIVKKATLQKKQAMESIGISNLPTSDIREAKSFERSVERLGAAGIESDVRPHAEQLASAKDLPPDASDFGSGTHTIRCGESHAKNTNGDGDPVARMPTSKARTLTMLKRLGSK